LLNLQKNGLLDNLRICQLADWTAHGLVKLQFSQLVDDAGNENYTTFCWLIYFIISSITNFTHTKQRSNIHIANV